MKNSSIRYLLSCTALAAVSLAFPVFASLSQPDVAVSSQYDTTHVLVLPAEFDVFVKSFIETFGGHPSQEGEFTVTPTPSLTMSQYVWTPSGNLSVFGFKTPVPYPFGQERTGYLVTDMEAAVKAARAAGAEIIVAPFNDPIGKDVIVQWPGGVKMQLYWHFKAPNYEQLERVPENRIYVSPDSADLFIRDFVRFAHGKVVSDDRSASGAEIGRSDVTFRRVRIESKFGKMVVLVTDGHLPYPFGHEITGYEVADLGKTLARANAAGAQLLAGPFASDHRNAAILQFPGGYIAEVHDVQ